MKIVLIVVTILIVIMLCMYPYAGYREIEIDELGSFKVPKDWVLTIEDDLVYFTNKSINESDCSYYLVEIINSKDEKGNDTDSSPIFGNAIYIDTIKSTILSNNVYYGQYLYEYEEKEIKKFYIKFLGDNDKRLTLIAWDDLIDEDKIMKIAKSYTMKEY